ncbi:MAG: DUF1850 domain-containing protein [Deltaproteobacteria bacterium]|nr:DUF1850 domain-containing protein [Deltaproteobacteria bacterium]
MTRPGKYILFFCTCLVFLSGFILLLIPGDVELWIVGAESGEPLLILPLKPGERFTLHYYHSVENSPIWEEHSLDKKGRIYIEEERYLKFGAGMGKMPGVGKMVRRGPYEVIENMHMRTGNFILRVGSPGVNHTIIWRGMRKNLSCIVPHRAVKFYGRQINMLQRLGRLIVPYKSNLLLKD